MALGGSGSWAPANSALPALQVEELEAENMKQLAWGPVLTRVLLGWKQGLPDSRALKNSFGNDQTAYKWVGSALLYRLLESRSKRTGLLALPVPPGGQSVCVMRVCAALLCFIFHKGCGNVFQETKLSFSLTKEIPPGLENLVKVLVAQRWVSGSWKASSRAPGRASSPLPLTPRGPLPLQRAQRTAAGLAGKGTMSCFFVNAYTVTKHLTHGSLFQSKLAKWCYYWTCFCPCSSLLLDRNPIYFFKCIFQDARN